MSVKTACRDINELHPTARIACELFLQECAKAGVKIFITETYRSQARQNYLYEQGRTRPGPKVTWTRNSNHKGRLAWDIAVNPPANLYDTTTLNKAGTIAKRLGITWGGDWKGAIDRPHFEVKKDWKSPLIAQEESPEPPKEEENDLYKPSNEELVRATSVVLGRLERKPNDPITNQWRQKLVDGTLTNSDAIGILFTAIERGHIVGK